MKQLITLFFLAVAQLVSAQSAVDLRAFDYSKADSIALSFPKKKYKTTEELTLALAAGLTTEQEKSRVIFRWITENVEYSYSNRKADAKTVMTRRKAICTGYATLLKEMCGTVGISCPVITGPAKTHASDIGKKYDSNHAWNAVSLNGSWYVVDVTWASGNFDDRKRKFTKSFKEFYFLTPPEQFVNDHFPAEKKWQLLAKHVSYRKFKNEPLREPPFFSKVSSSYEEKGKLKATTKKPLELVIPLDTEPQRVTLEIGEDKFYTPSVSKDENGNYVLTQPLDKPGNFEMNVFIDGKHILRHKLKVR